jgi:hypothetical protein
MFFWYRFLQLFFNRFGMENASKSESKGTFVGVLLATFSDDRFVAAFCSPSGSLLALFWSQLAPFGFLLAPFGPTFDFNRRLFGTLWSPFGDPGVTFCHFWHPLASLRHACCNFHDFNSF